MSACCGSSWVHIPMNKNEKIIWKQKQKKISEVCLTKSITSFNASTFIIFYFSIQKIRKQKEWKHNNEDAGNIFWLNVHQVETNWKENRTCDVEDELNSHFALSDRT